MAFQPERVKGLMRVKGRLKQDELKSIAREELTRWLNGHREMSLDDLKRLALALDATSDYLIGLGDNYRSGGDHDNYELAAAKMSFIYFLNIPALTSEQRQRCGRVWQNEHLLVREGAPRTAEAWKSLAEIIDRAVPTPPRIGEARSA